MILKKLVISSYAALLKLYPIGFQRKYSEEMNIVFVDLLESPEMGNSWKTVRCILNECLVLPGCLIREYFAVIGGIKMKTTKQNLIITSVGFMLLFLLSSLDWGYFRSAPANSWTHTTFYSVIDLFVEAILYGLLGGGVISLALSSTKKKQIMLTCGLGYLISSFITSNMFWELLSFPTKWINQNLDSLLIFASSPLMGFLIGLMVGWVWKGWKAGLIFSIASAMIFTLGFWINYLSWYVLATVLQDNMLLPRSWLMINWIVGYLLFGGVVGILWGILTDRIQHLPIFSLSSVMN